MSVGGGRVSSHLLLVCRRGEGAISFVACLSEGGGCHLIASFLSQKIPVPELRGTDKRDIIELAVVMQSGRCPYIVEFYGCLIRDVCMCVCLFVRVHASCLCELKVNFLKDIILLCVCMCMK